MHSWIRVITISTLVGGAFVCAGLIYFFLYTNPVVEQSDIGSGVQLNKGALDRVLNWVAAKEKGTATIPSVSPRVFYTPPPSV